MSDKAEKLKALSARLGLKTGAEIAPPAPHSRRIRSAMGEEECTPQTDAPRQSSPPLSALRSRLNLMAGMEQAGGRLPGDEEVRSCQDAFEIDRVLPGQVMDDGDGGGFYLVRHDYPMDYAQGAVPLGAALESGSQHIAFSANDSALAAFDPRKALFIDTETTGLAGGTGTVAFLVGVGYFHDGMFRLDQCFMRDYDEEEAMLRFLGGLSRDFETLVSYNGKSFDLPLLRTRFIQNRVPGSFEHLGHFDLVHAARRFWRRRLRDCRLGNIEREVLGVRRVGDVPSYLIPQIYFDYLNSRDARCLEGVFYHHRMDILSLASLTGWISRCLTKPDGFEHAEDRLSIVRMHFLQKHYGDVASLGKQFLALGEGAALRRECLEMMGFAHKRMGEWEPMQEVFEKLLREFPADATARLELAKLHEHRTRNLLEARRLCEEGLQHYYTQRALDRPTDLGEGVASALEQRLVRIKRKLSRGGHAPVDFPDFQ